MYLSESLKIIEKSTVLITAEEEYEKNPEISKENIDDLRKWIVSQPHLPQNIPGKSFLKLKYNQCFKYKVFINIVLIFLMYKKYNKV